MIDHLPTPPIAFPQRGAQRIALIHLVHRLKAGAIVELSQVLTQQAILHITYLKRRWHLLGQTRQHLGLAETHPGSAHLQKIGVDQLVEHIGIAAHLRAKQREFQFDNSLAHLIYPSF